MGDWIHCNQCGSKLRRDAKFYIKECGRIECQNCLKPIGDGESICKTCGKSCRTILLANDMKPEVQMFFKPVAVLMDNAKKVYEFQLKNQQNLLKLITQKYNFAKSEALKSYKTIDAYKKEITKLKMTLNKENQVSTSFRTSTSTPIHAGLTPPTKMKASKLTNALSSSKQHYPRSEYPRRMPLVENQHGLTPSRFSTSTPLQPETSIGTSPSLSTITNMTSISKYPYIRPGYAHRVSSGVSNFIF